MSVRVRSFHLSSRKELPPRLRYHLELPTRQCTTRLKSTRHRSLSEENQSKRDSCPTRKTWETSSTQNRQKGVDFLFREEKLKFNTNRTEPTVRVKTRLTTHPLLTTPTNGSVRGKVHKGTVLKRVASPDTR